MNRYLLRAALALGALATPFAAAAEILTFDSPVTLSATQAPGTWYTDRYAPGGFVGGVAFDGRSVLEHSISAADAASNRPAPFSSAFYNTQGRKYDIPATVKMSIELYVAASYADLSQRIAGFWGTGFDAGSAVSAFPILEYTTDGTDRFRAYNSNDGTFTDYAGAITTDAWHTLEIELSGGLFTYSIDGDAFYSYDANGSTEIGNVILQGHNTTDGVNYVIHWDNLSTQVPEPATLLLLGLGLAGIGLARRRA